jgi:Ion transport protein
MNWIDIISITPYFIALSLPSQSNGVQLLSILRLLRIIKLIKLSDGAAVVGKALLSSAEALWLLLLSIIFILVISSALMHFASQTMFVSAFIDKVITDEQLNPNDIIMVKYLQLVNFTIYKIFKSVDVQNKSTLVRMINVYADGFLVRMKITRKILIELRSISLRLFKEVVTSENLKQMILRKESFIQRLQITIVFSNAFRVIFQVLDKNLQKAYVIK